MNVVYNYYRFVPLVSFKRYLVSLDNWECDELLACKLEMQVLANQINYVIL